MNDQLRGIEAIKSIPDEKTPLISIRCLASQDSPSNDVQPDIDDASAATLAVTFSSDRKRLQMMMRRTRKTETMFQGRAEDVGWHLIKNLPSILQKDDRTWVSPSGRAQL